jgi:hypothetical protein
MGGSSSSGGTRTYDELSADRTLPVGAIESIAGGMDGHGRKRADRK